MLKQFILIVLLSALTIMFKSQLSHGLDGVVGMHNLLAGKLHIIFSDDEIGLMIQDMIALLLIPLMCGVTVTAGFWLFKRAAMPHMMGVFWILWLVLVVTMLAQDGIVKNQMASLSHSRMQASIHS